MKKESVAVLIISNGPGELSTWVKPVVDSINKINDSYEKNERLSLSISLILVPCPNSTGKEYQVAKSWNQFEVVTKAETFWKL